jgi:hypothetical protein
METPPPRDPKLATKMLVFVGLSLSIGWGIRGNFGHEWGAALPGALAALAVVLLSQREDWMRRIAYFGMFGAIGWSFGGSMAYMILIAFTHSGDSASVAYGFACLFIVGFLWGTIGGGATALPAFLDRERLTEFFAPFTALLILWQADGYLQDHFIESNPRFHGRNPLDWHDINWTSALLAIIVVLARGAIRRRLTWADRLILSMAAGWWVGFLVLAIGLRLEMIPSRSANWAGCVGMAIAMWFFLHRSRLPAVILASLTTGIVGGLGFALATLFKLIEIKSGLATNWHSVLEQTYGLINGIGLAVAMLQVRRAAPPVSDDPPTRRWTDAAAVWFLLVVLTYLNLQKEVKDWTDAKAVPLVLYGLPAHGWFDLVYGLAAIVIVVLLLVHLRERLAVVPSTWLGKGQMLYLVLLWWMVIGNFTKALVAFAPERLVTEGVITLNALLCTLMTLLWARRSEPSQATIKIPGYRKLLARTAATASAALAISTLVCWGIVRAIYGNQFAGYAGRHIRFGPHQTKNKQ